MIAKANEIAQIEIIWQSSRVALRGVRKKLKAETDSQRGQEPYDHLRAARRMRPPTRIAPTAATPPASAMPM